ncbi:MAG: polyphosphate kinase 1 [Bacillota bacterium]|nr:polyphosphate kinase 1 [Bacillota bacterium]
MKAGKIPQKCYVSRDISWLGFNKRVMLQAKNKSIPLVERLKFLSIYYSNLEEFFMVRVGSLDHRAKYIPNFKDEKTGRTSSEELKEIFSEVSEQQALAKEVYDELILDFASFGIEKVDFKHLSKSDEIMTKKMFAEYKDLLSPRIIDQQHPLPFLTGGEGYACVLLEKNGREKIGLISLYRLPKYKTFESQSGKQKVVIVTELVNYYMQQLFKKYNVKEKCILKVTRNADVFFEDYEKGDSEDSRFDMKKLLKKRKRSAPVRLCVCGKITAKFKDTIRKLLGLSLKEVFVSTVPFDINFTGEIIIPSEMKYAPRKPVRTVKLPKGETMNYLRTKDILLSFPYQSISPFIDLIYEAADDDSVASISITLYRLAASSRLAAALAYAADKGKDVLCLLELRARFDEQNNVDYSELLEEAGCSVIYGLEHMKVHSKLLLIKRQKPDGGLEYITQLGTGNYNEVTAEQYTDISILTSNEAVGKDADEIFKALAIGEVPPDTQNLLVSPKGFKKKLLGYLEDEKEKGSAGRVSIKVNGLNDIDVMNKLVECSKAGVKIELFIRGICCLKPNLAGYTDNITAKSVIGRYLEHSRIYVFGEGADRKIFVGSGDLLNRNTQRRVEAFIRVTSKNVEEAVLEIMDAFRMDVDNSWIMQPDGTYMKMPIATGKDEFERLAEYFSSKVVTMDARSDNAAVAKKEAGSSLKTGWFKRLFKIG